MNTTDKINFLKRNTISYLTQELYCKTLINITKPSNILIQPTIRCNSHCQMCHEWQSRITELPIELWEKTMKELIDWVGPYTKINFAGGEVLFWKDGFRLIAYTAKRNRATGLVTNAFLITPSLAKKLMKLNLLNINISLDGIQPETHDITRGFPGAGKKAIEGIENLCINKKNSHASTKLIIKTIIGGFNIQELIPLTEWVYKKQLDGIMFQPILPTFDEPYHNNWQKSSPLWPKRSQMKTLQRVIQELITLQKKGYPILNSKNHLEEMMDYFLMKKEKRDISHQTCLAGIDKLSIWEDGRVAFCDSMPPLGSITENTVKHIWNSKKANTIRTMVLHCKKQCLQTCYFQKSLFDKISFFRMLIKQ